MTPETFNRETYFEDIGAWPPGAHAIRRSYIAGFIASLALTLAAFSLAAENLPPLALLLPLALLALMQFIVQVSCFLHLGAWPKARERVAILCMTFIIIGIILGGSLWIMITLNDRMMPSTAQMEQFMSSQDSI